MIKPSRKLSLGCILMSCLLSTSYAQINKAYVDKAPKEAFAPMPHIDPEREDRMVIRQDEATNAWRKLRDPERNPKREAGPIDIQRYFVQLEPVGVKTFFQLPVAATAEDLVAG